MTQRRKINRCKYSYPEFDGNKIKHYCVANNKKEYCTNEQCEICDQFNSKYIEYPITVNEIVQTPIDATGHSYEVGNLCEIRLCSDPQPYVKTSDDESHINDTYIGIYIGDLPLMITSSFDQKSGTLTNTAIPNAAFFVPELKRIVYGSESFHRKLDNIDNLKGISNEDIDNIWYVKLLRAASTNTEGE